MYAGHMLGLQGWDLTGPGSFQSSKGFSPWKFHPCGILESQPYQPAQGVLWGFEGGTMLL